MGTLLLDWHRNARTKKNFMKLYHYLNTNHLMFQDEPFMQLLLKRLSIMEALATIKFKQRSIEDCRREAIIMTTLRNKCQASDFSIKKTGFILSIFLENISLAKCIQRACFQEWDMMSVETVEQLGLMSARSIISTHLSDHMLLHSLREYIDYITDAMFDALRSLNKTSNLNKLIEPLISCFPHINQYNLETIMSNIMKYMTKLLSLPPGNEKYETT